MRILAIGDIHGCSVAFDTLMATVKPVPEDKIITLGDYVDRGPDSSGVIERVIALSKTGQLVALRGNHEIMMLQARYDRATMKFWWHECGGDTTLASYAPTGALADVPPGHWDFLEHACVDYYETQTHFFVHANAYPDLPLVDQPADILFWERFHNSAPHCSGKVMVCGHTSQQSGLPVNLGHAICIDTWVYGDGWLSCLDVVSGRLWQANQAGAQRSLWIDEST